MPELPLILAGGPWAAVIAMGALIITSVVRGWLVPGRTVERTEQLLIQRGDDWRDAYIAEVARGEVRDAQMTEILQFVRRSAAPPPQQDPA